MHGYEKVEPPGRQRLCPKPHSGIVRGQQHEQVLSSSAAMEKGIAGHKDERKGILAYSCST